MGERTKALLHRLALAAMTVFMVSWLIAWFVHPVPGWVIPVMLASFGTAFGSLALYWLLTGFSPEEQAHEDEPAHWSSPAENGVQPDPGSRVEVGGRARTYRISGFELIYLVIFATGWFAAVMFIALRHMPQRWTLGEVVSAILVVLFALLPAAVTATVPHEVFISEEGECRFRSLVRSRTLRAQQIRSVDSDEGGHRPSPRWWQGQD
jgi:hypothetical protein